MARRSRGLLAAGIGAATTALAWQLAVLAAHADDRRVSVGRIEKGRAAVNRAEEPAPADVLLSRQLMEQAGVKVGDIVTLATAAAGGRTAQFRIVGSYEPTPDPTHFTARRLEARLHLQDLIALTADPLDPQTAESVGALNVALTRPEDADAVRSAVVARMPGLAVRPTSRPSDGTDLFGVLDRFHRAIAIVTVVGSTAFLLALMVMRAEERREIVGSLRLIGISSRTILGEVFFEGLLIALAGALFGVVLAGSAQGLVNRFFQWQYDTPLVFMRVTPAIAWRSAAFAVPLGVFAGVAASWALLRGTVGSLVRR